MRIHPSLSILAVSLTTLISATAAADIAPPVPDGEVYVSHEVRIDNLAEHPDFVVVLFDPPREGKIKGHVVFRAGEEPQQLIANGRSWRSLERFRRPKLWLMSRTAEQQWTAQINTEIEEQRQACMNGEGCAHISRFFPRYSAPTGAVDCGVQLEVRGTRPRRRGEQQLDAYRVVEASSTLCRLAELRTGALPTGSGTTHQGSRDPRGSVLIAWAAIGAFLLILLGWTLSRRRDGGGEAPA